MDGYLGGDGVVIPPEQTIAAWPAILRAAAEQQGIDLDAPTVAHVTVSVAD